MAEHSLIEWTDATWNPVTGCTIVSAGCTNCYAMRLAGGRLRHHPSRVGLVRHSSTGPKWTGDVRFNEEWLEQPLGWKQGRRIFVCAHGDLFHPAVPDEWIARVWDVMARAPQHTFQVLTKRAERMRTWVNLRPIALANVHLGVSAEDQASADDRLPHLVHTHAAVRFASLEPLLGPIKLRQAIPGLHHLHWVIVGGESGHRARPMDVSWVRSLRDQCEGYVPFFFKQWGEYLGGRQDGNRERQPVVLNCTDESLRVGKHAAGRELDGRTWDELPVSADDIPW